jgi:hypothetical protein
MSKIIKEIYGVGILFFYYMKYIILFGWPLLRYGLDYKDNIIMNMLWFFCFTLFVKDMIYKFVLKKRYCDDDPCSTLHK